MRTGLAWLDRIGSVGALAATVAAPCCFPLFAAASAALGIGTLGRYETLLLYLFQAFAVVSLLGLALAFREHRRAGPLAIGLASIGALAYTFYVLFRPVTLYSGLFGLLAATVWNYFCSRRVRPVLQSIITCPQCGQPTEETMPTNACVFFYDCPVCHSTLKPLAGDCCVFCSYALFRARPCRQVRHAAPEFGHEIYPGHGS